jgi:hypothetical protein
MDIEDPEVIMVIMVMVVVLVDLGTEIVVMMHPKHRVYVRKEQLK